MAQDKYLPLHARYDKAKQPPLPNPRPWEMSSLAETIKAFRKHFNLSAAQLGSRLNKSAACVYNLERAIHQSTNPLWRLALRGIAADLEIEKDE